MSKVDLKSLKNVASGNPRDKVMVTKGWLKAIHDEIEELRKRPKEEQLTAAQQRELDKGMDETFEHMDRAFASMDGMFGKLFGKGSGLVRRVKRRG